MNSNLRPGDWLVVGGGMMLVAALFMNLWGASGATKLIIRSGGAIVAEGSLSRNQSFAIEGPLGTTLVEVADRRVRVARDPSPRQYCVKQGWLSRAGETVLCLPNQVSVELAGKDKRYDSLSY